MKLQTQQAGVRNIAAAHSTCADDSNWHSGVFDRFIDCLHGQTRHPGGFSHGKVWSMHDAINIPRIGTNYNLSHLAKNTRSCSHTSCTDSRFRSAPSANRKYCRRARLPSGSVLRALQPDPYHWYPSLAEWASERL